MSNYPRFWCRTWTRRLSHNYDMARIGVNTERRVLNSRLRLKRRFATFGLYIIAIATAFYGLGFLFWSEIFSIKSMAISGLDKIERADLESNAWKVLDGRRFILLSKRHSIFYPKRVLASMLLARLPRLASIRSNSDRGILKIEVQEHLEEYVWCAQACYFMTKSGVLFAPTASSSEFIVFRHQGEPRGSVGKTVLKADFVNEMIKLIKLLNSRKLWIVSVNLQGQDVFMAFKPGWSVRFVATEQVEIIYEKLMRVLDTDDIINKGVDNLLYVDQRFGNKIYYKFRE